MTVALRTGVRPRAAVTRRRSSAIMVSCLSWRIRPERGSRSNRSAGTRPRPVAHGGVVAVEEQVSPLGPGHSPPREPVAVVREPSLEPHGVPAPGRRQAADDRGPHLGVPVLSSEAQAVTSQDRPHDRVPGRPGNQK